MIVVSVLELPRSKWGASVRGPGPAEFPTVVLSPAVRTHRSLVVDLLALE